MLVLIYFRHRRLFLLRLPPIGYALLSRLVCHHLIEYSLGLLGAEDAAQALDELALGGAAAAEDQVAFVVAARPHADAMLPEERSVRGGGALISRALVVGEVYRDALGAVVGDVAGCAQV